MIVIATVNDHLEHGYKIALYCPRCRRDMAGFYSLHRLVMLGKGDKPLSRVSLRYGCGSKVEIRRIPPLLDVAPAKS